MKDFVSKLLQDKIVEAKEVLNQRIQDLVNEKVNQVKLRLAAEMYDDFEVEEEELSEANVQKMGRTKLIRVRFRAGKVQRRVKKSAVPGFTIQAQRRTRLHLDHGCQAPGLHRFHRFEREGAAFGIPGRCPTCDQGRHAAFSRPAP